MVKVEKRPGRYTRVVRFAVQLPWSASAVMLVGDFNRWDVDADALQQATDSYWERTLLLEPGQYEYQYLVNDAQWMIDPDHTETIANPFGTMNSRIVVR
jgi:1,4-alpha-glucan branching enzyme